MLHYNAVSAICTIFSEPRQSCVSLFSYTELLGPKKEKCAHAPLLNTRNVVGGVLHCAMMLQVAAICCEK